MEFIGQCALLFPQVAYAADGTPHYTGGSLDFLQFFEQHLETNRSVNWVLLIDATFRRLVYERRASKPDEFLNMPAAIADVLQYEKHIWAEVRMNCTVDDAVGTHNLGIIDE